MPQLQPIIYVSVLYFKSNDKNPTIDPPFRPPEGTQLKRPRRDPSEPGVVWPLLPLQPIMLVLCPILPCRAFYGAPCSSSHFIASVFPPAAANARTLAPHGQPSVPISSRLIDSVCLVPSLIFSCGSRSQGDRGRLSKYPSVAALSRVSSVHGQPCSRAHFKSSSCPATAADSHVLASHGQLRCRAHFNISKCPPSAAKRQVFSFHGQKCSRAHFNTSSCPPSAA